MNTERILNNDLGILMSRSDEGKTHTPCGLITEYKKQFNGNVTTFGFRDELIDLLTTEFTQEHWDIFRARIDIKETINKEANNAEGGERIR